MAGCYDSILCDLPYRRPWKCALWYLELISSLTWPLPKLWINHRITNHRLTNQRHRKKLLQKHLHGTLEHSNLRYFNNSTVCFGSRTFLSRHIGPLQFLLTISPPVILTQYVLFFIIWSVHVKKVFFSLPKNVCYVDYCS